MNFEKYNHTFTLLVYCCSGYTIHCRIYLYMDMTSGQRRRGRRLSDDLERLESQADLTRSKSARGSQRGRWILHSMRRCRLPFVILVAILFGMGLVHYMTLDTDSSAIVKSGSSFVKSNSPLGKVALVFIAHDRPEYFKESLNSVIQTNGLDRVDLIVSMDYPPQFDALEEVVGEFSTHAHPITVWKNVMPFGNFFHTSDDRITYHHKQIFRRLFNVAGYDYAIMLESDLTVSSDFLDYMFGAGHLLNPENPASENLFCISGWNDNGMQHFSLNETRLFRTDFFPGLGWMLHKSMWLEQLESQWPGRFGNYAYDIWLRDGSTTRNRDCIVPEVSRTHHISKYGSHVNGASHTWYDAMVLASGKVLIPKEEIDLVASMEAFENRIRAERLSDARIVSFSSSFQTPYNASIVVVVEDQASWYQKQTDSVPPNYFKLANEAFGLFNHNFRSRHKGLVTVTLGKSFGYTNVTLVTQRMRNYWNV